MLCDWLQNLHHFLNQSKAKVTSIISCLAPACVFASNSGLACSRLRDSGESVNWEKERETKRRGWGNYLLLASVVTSVSVSLHMVENFYKRWPAMQAFSGVVHAWVPKSRLIIAPMLDLQKLRELGKRSVEEGGREWRKFFLPSPPLLFFIIQSNSHPLVTLSTLPNLLLLLKSKVVARAFTRPNNMLHCRLFKWEITK